MTPAAKRKKFSLLRCLLLLVPIAAGAAFVFMVVLPSQEAWGGARSLSQALEGARSVTIEEFSPRGVCWDRGYLISRVTASPDQIAKLRAATGAWLARVPPRPQVTYAPHHRIKIVRADGLLFEFEICFQCGSFRLGEQAPVGFILPLGLPEPWVKPLRKFFAEAGMPPRESYGEAAQKNPDYLLTREEIRDLEKTVNDYEKELPNYPKNPSLENELRAARERVEFSRAKLGVNLGEK